MCVENSSQLELSWMWLNFQPGFYKSSRSYCIRPVPWARLGSKVVGAEAPFKIRGSEVGDEDLGVL